jgi:hypothetical protein
MSAPRSPVTVAEVKAAARRRYDRDHRAWAARLADARLEVPLHPPTEASALLDTRAAVDWVTSWRASPLTVVWETRRWANLGAQEVPVRCVLDSPEAIATAAGTSMEWRRLDARATALRDRWIDAAPAALASAIRTSARMLLALSEADLQRFRAVLEWVAVHPTSGWYVRQLPIRGVDGKWIEQHGGLVRTFVSALTGTPSLGLRENPSLIRVRFLDPALAPGGLRDLAAPASELARLDLLPRVVLVFENLESVIAMPDLEGAVVVHGSGYAVDRLRGIPWIRDGRVVYWGDIDSHGFAILDRLRAHVDEVTSVLMDARTLSDHLDLAGDEPSPTRAAFTRLTADEDAVLAAVRNGDRRLEQERIEWGYALARLAEACRP